MHNTSYFKIFENKLNNFLLNSGISLENENILQSETYTFNEGNIEKSNDNIDLDELLKIDFKQIFYKQPSQVNRKEGDFTETKFKQADHEEDNSFLNKKTHRGDPEVEEKRKEILDR